MLKPILRAPVNLVLGCCYRCCGCCCRCGCCRRCATGSWSLCQKTAHGVPKFIRFLIRVVRSRLFIALALSMLVVFACSRYMSYTLFHYFTTLDDYTARKGDDESSNFLAAKNNERIRMANNYLESFNRSEFKSKFVRLLKPGPSKDVTITIVTIDRLMTGSIPDRPYYFTQTVAKLLRELEDYYGDITEEDLHNSQKLKIELTFCAVDILPFINKEVELVENLTSFSTIARFGYGHPAPPGYIQLVNRFEREKQDYSFCLNNSLHRREHEGRNPSYVLLLEDDAPPIKGYFMFLEDLIRKRLDRTDYGRSDNEIPQDIQANRDSILYVKLFHPNSLLEFHSVAPERIPQLISVAFLMSCAAWILYAYLRKRFSPNDRLHFSWNTFAQLFVYFTVMSLVVGRPNIVFHYQNILASYFNTITLVPAPSCCTPAILYPNSAISTVVTSLETANCYEQYAKDGVLDTLKSWSPRKAWLVQPNLHQHVGQFSIVRRQKNVNYRHFLGIEY